METRSVDLMLPCFRYIAQNLDQKNASSVASFAMDLLQYLDRCGVTDPSEIEHQFIKITLLSQFSTSHSGSLDLLRLKDEQYSLASMEEYEKYRTALLKVCKKPRSFSALYKSCDSKLGLCKVCPMSEHYTLQFQKEELQLLKFVLSSSENFRSIITSAEDSAILFQSHYELYNIFRNVSKPASFPAIRLIVDAVYREFNSFFSPLFGPNYFPGISGALKSSLVAFGIKKGVDGLPEDYVPTICQHIMQCTSSMPELNKQAAARMANTLRDRGEYRPPFDADAVPQIDVSASSRKGKTRDATTIKKGRKTLDVYPIESALTGSIDLEMGLLEKRDTVPSGKSAATSLPNLDGTGAVSEDHAIRSDEGNVIMLSDFASAEAEVVIDLTNEPGLNDEPEVNFSSKDGGQVNLEMSLITEKMVEIGTAEPFNADILSPDEDMVITIDVDDIPDIPAEFHSEPESSGASFKDGTEIADAAIPAYAYTDSDEDTADVSHEADENTGSNSDGEAGDNDEIPFAYEDVYDSLGTAGDDSDYPDDPSAFNTDADFSPEISDMANTEESDGTFPRQETDSEEAEKGKETASDEKVDVTADFDDTDGSGVDAPEEHKFKTDLRVPFVIENEWDLSNFEIIASRSGMDRLFSYCDLDRFCVMEPVLIKGSLWLCVYVHKHFFLIHTDHEFALEMLRFYRTEIYTARPLALYSYVSEQPFRLRKARFLPLDTIMFSNGEVRIFENLATQMEYLSGHIADGGADKDAIERRALLCEAYGFSLYYDRFLDMGSSGSRQFAYFYKEDGTILPARKIPKQSDIAYKASDMSGTLFQVFYRSDKSPVYDLLNEECILHLADKACFSKFKLGLLDVSNRYVLVFAESRCADYIYNTLLVSFFKNATKLNLAPFDVLIKKKNVVKNAS